MAVGALVNGGNLITPTFLKRDARQAPRPPQRVIKPETSEAMRYVLRLNAANPAGSASTAAIAGFFVGGKTGTAEKVIDGRYSKNKNFTTFTAVAPGRQAEIRVPHHHGRAAGAARDLRLRDRRLECRPGHRQHHRAGRAAPRRAAALRAAGAALPAHDALGAWGTR